MLYPKGSKTNYATFERRLLRRFIFSNSRISFDKTNIFAKTGENEYMFDSYILKGAKDKMILGSDEKYFLPSTFKLTVDPAKEEVVSAYYEYSDGISQSGSETLSFLYGEDVKLKSSLEEKND